MIRQSTPGPWFALPLILFFGAFFAAPIAIVFWYSLMPARTFELGANFTVENYITIFRDGYGRPLMWSLIGATLTTLTCLLLAWPTAKALNRHIGRAAMLVTALIALPIFISESVRLFGLSIFMMPRGGILAGSLNACCGLEIGSVLNTRIAALIGMIYIHFPFMLFPLLLGIEMIPRDRVEAARDLGAGGWAVFREVELPLALPGLLIGVLLTFVLALGANAEAAILGGRAVTVITAAIDQRFNYAQDWPSGSALTVLVIVASVALVVPILSRINISKLTNR
ncbi:ABC transporter permease [Tabrizicola sp. BL-A-41-H6]|uniref:ABC transporter permease n=1 Tax=Tabrizicola sp. BL-A-41-H6 TaxID=3421107 RepID=UPI003D679227